ncbi:hypothetical protein RGQ15_16610 [Paracoccus sp. MBLB3053]|uniref:Uncharacterized protein n=1 Tax=Paracoccus aurantius TaxID=3073814 RepID=A0ABU2HVV7_9RHOB|nr:hypothetical protein [Paracoccus sp. MBLB3053]MDS9469184.1 hypothetical protein [Paracoccus sp. MBLB3053]
MKITFISADGTETVVTAAEGESVMRAELDGVSIHLPEAQL